MAQEKAHRVVDHRVCDQMVIINDQIKRAMPLSQLNKELREKGGQADVLAFLHHDFTGGAMPARCLLKRGN